MVVYRGHGVGVTPGKKYKIQALANGWGVQIYTAEDLFTIQTSPGQGGCVKVLITHIACDATGSCLCEKMVEVRDMEERRQAVEDLINHTLPTWLWE